MGGKRPDQYRIDPDDSRTTDNKFMPNTPQEGERQHELLSKSRKAARGQPIPSRAPEPETERLRARMREIARLGEVPEEE